MEEPEKINTPELLKKVIDEKGIEWVIAAMVEGSIGYHTPKHARMLINKALEGGTKDWCERCDACFGTDLFEMICFDIGLMKRMEERLPDKAARLVEAVKAISKMSDEAQMSVSLAYPTINI